jgi:hypothetical protein
MTLEIRAEDIRQDTPSANTTPDQFKVIDNVKDEPTLKEAQDFVGGYVEGITFPNGDYMIINEEGKLINLPLNVEATALWRATFTKDKYLFGYDDYVCGPVIYIKRKALKRVGIAQTSGALTGAALRAALRAYGAARHQ